MFPLVKALIWVLFHFFKLINFNENEQNQTHRLIFLKTTGGGETKVQFSSSVSIYSFVPQFKINHVNIFG